MGIDGMERLAFYGENLIVERYFRLTEIAFFFLPLSAIVLSFVSGSQAVSSSADEFSQAGAAIGTAIGGAFVVILAFIVGISGGVIMHLVAGRYAKKAKSSKTKQPEGLFGEHGVILSLGVIILLAITIGSIASGGPAAQTTEANDAAQTPATAPAESNSVDLEIVEKGFHQADVMAGEYRDQITMDLKFGNKTGKAMKSVQGIVTFYDIFDSELLTIDIAYDEGLDAYEEKIWNAAIDYNQFMDGHDKLKTNTLENLKYQWQVKAVVYEDGSKETF